MQTIPDAVLDQIVQHRPHLAGMAANLRNHPDQAAQIEQALATAYLLGETRLSAQETWYLSQVAHGGPWGGDWVRATHAAILLDVDESRIRQRILAGELPAVKYGKTWFVRRDALQRKEPPMQLYRVKTTGDEFRYTYDQTTDGWEKTETANEYRVQVVDAAGFEELAEDDPAIVSYQAL